MDGFLFWVFAIVGVACGVMVVWHRNPMSSAIYLVVTMLSLAGLYVLLDGPFMAVIQVLIYAGAVMVLMLFVIMMLNLGEETLRREGTPLAWAVAGVIGLILIFKLGARFGAHAGGKLAEQTAGFGTIQSTGAELFGNFALPFELTSILLLVAIVGAVILAKRTSE